MDASIEGDGDVTAVGDPVAEARASGGPGDRSSARRRGGAGRACGGRSPVRLARAQRTVQRTVQSHLSSSLTRRIVVLNLGGLVALLAGFLYLNQFREGLIDARVQSLQTQGEIIAAAVAASATVDTDAISIDPEKLLKLAPGESASGAEGGSPLEFSLNPERVGPLLRRLVSPTRLRARIYDRDGFLLLDFALRLRPLEHSALRAAAGGGQPTTLDASSFLERSLRVCPAPVTSAGAAALRRHRHGQWQGLSGGRQRARRPHSFGGARQRQGRNHHFRRRPGSALPRRCAARCCSRRMGGDIDAIIVTERWGIIRIFLVSAGVMLLISLFFTNTITEPMRRLAEAAERVRRGVKSRQEIPDFSDRPDEIGHLSGALRDMTKALYNRIDAIEHFAADVAHELKNPLDVSAQRRRDAADRQDRGVARQAARHHQA